MYDGDTAIFFIDQWKNERLVCSNACLIDSLDICHLHLSEYYFNENGGYDGFLDYGYKRKERE
jgi:hypothetical protein